MTELLPCPFCGADTVKLRENPHASMSWVSCTSCGLEAPTETGTDAAKAVEYWNTRALVAAPAQGWDRCRLQARPAEGGDWIDIFPAQLEWMAKEGHSVRALESSDGGVENRRHAARGLRTPKTAQDGQEGGPLGSAPQGHPEEHIAGVASGPSDLSMREALEAAQAHLLKYTGGFAANNEEAALFEKIRAALLPATPQAGFAPSLLDLAERALEKGRPSAESIEQLSKDLVAAGESEFATQAGPAQSEPVAWRKTMQWIADQRWNEDADLDDICLAAEKALAALQSSQPEAGESDPLVRLWKAITDNTTNESFWLAEILLNEISKETGYNGPKSPRSSGQSSCGKWLPIESAPKDGTRILYIDKFGGIGHCQWMNWPEEDNFEAWWDYVCDDEVIPRAWMPALPDVSPSSNTPGGVTTKTTEVRDV